jgi:hypothetical protein
MQTPEEIRRVLDESGYGFLLTDEQLRAICVVGNIVARYHEIESGPHLDLSLDDKEFLKSMRIEAGE